MDVLRLVTLSRQVAKTHNGKAYPRHMQIASMQKLQAFFTALDLAAQQDVASTVQASLPRP